MAITHPHGMSSTERALVVSLDSHVTPDISEYRPYCEARHLDVFDQFVSAFGEHLANLVEQDYAVSTPRSVKYLREIEARYPDPGSDMERRLREMDADGIAAEVLFHGGFNRQPIPFGLAIGPRATAAARGWQRASVASGDTSEVPQSQDDHELRCAGMRMYNAWLGDWIKQAPHRFIGLAHIPFWDVGAAVNEVIRASEAGLRGVNLPAPRRTVPGYNMPEWEPLWAACADRGMVLHTHGGGGDLPPIEGPGRYGVLQSEVFFYARRGLWQLIFGGVFERYPSLRLFLTEQSGGWVVDTLQTLDSAYLSPMQSRHIPHIEDIAPQLPSEYFRSNCYVGASFMSRAEAEMAIEHGVWQNFTWGRDYPHPEGAWPFTLQSLRRTFAGLAADPVRAMLGETALRALDLDANPLRQIAARIGPTFAQLDQPLESVPEGSHLSLAFRSVGSFA